MPLIIETKRLLLRTWNDSDAIHYYNINQDPKVIEHLPCPMTMDAVNEFVKYVNLQQEEKGYTLWAVEAKESKDFMGFVGLNYADFKTHFAPAVEVGWRLGSQFWGKGYATEAALASIEHGFNNCNLKEVVSFTVPSNLRSISVMERLGMKRDLNGDFAHPKLPLDHRLSKHVLYRISKV